MSLIPFLFDDADLFRPIRFLDQHFDLGLDPSDLRTPISIPRNARMMLRNHPSYYRPWRSAQSKDIGSTVSVDSDKFQVNLDVQQFSPEEITVKLTGDNCVTVEGKHEEKEDEHGFISRHFIRRYIVPKDHDMDKIESKLSSDGVLTITAPRSNVQAVEHRNIPIVQTGVPSKAAEKMPEPAEQ